VLLPASHAPKKDAPGWPGFLTCGSLRRPARLPRLTENPVTDLGPGGAGSRVGSEASLAAYSGGTVWVFHPLPMAAGASVELCSRLYQIASDARFSYDTMIMSGDWSPLECSGDRLDPIVSVAFLELIVAGAN
jgi:hypothetical protein